MVKKITKLTIQEVKTLGTVFNKAKLKYAGTFAIPIAGAALSIWLYFKDYRQHKKDNKSP